MVSLKQLVALTDSEKTKIKNALMLMFICSVCVFVGYKFGVRDGFNVGYKQGGLRGYEDGRKNMMEYMIKELKKIGVEINVK